MKTKTFTLTELKENLGKVFKSLSDSTILLTKYGKTKAENGFVWLEVYSQPGWKLSDHILVDPSK